MVTACFSCALCSTTSLKLDDKFGLTQFVPFDQQSTQLSTIHVSLWCKGELITGQSDDGLAIYVDFHFVNNTHSYGNTLPLPTGELL